MSDRAASAAGAAKPIWMKQAEEARVKSEAEKDAIAKAAFEATFKALENSKSADNNNASAPADDSDGSSDDDDNNARGSALSARPAGPVDPSRCLAAGAGIAGGTAGAPSTFTVVPKDSDGRKISAGGAHIKVKISPGFGVGGADQEGIVKDQSDGTYAVTYTVPKRGNYMVHVECNGRPIMGSPFPVFFSTGTVMGTTGLTPTISPYPNMVNQTMPNMPNYSGSVSGAFPGLLGMIPGMTPGASGGVVLPGMAGAVLGEVCREYLNGRCAKTDCKFSHPPQQMLITALAGSTTMGSLSQQPMAPSAAAMAAAQAIVAARQAAQMQMHTQAQTVAGDSSGSPDKVDALKRTLQVSNLSPLLTAEHLKQLFAYCGTVVDCRITDSKHFAYVEFSKPEEATAAVALNNMDVGGRPLNVEMAKSLPPKIVAANTSLPLALQQAVALQQMQFQQALIMQQTLASQQAASRAATMKSATDMAAARAAEISKKLKAAGLVGDDKDTVESNRNSRSSSPRRKSKSRSRSPIKYRQSRRSRSISPSIRFSRDRRPRSPIRYHRYSRGIGRRSYIDDRNSYNRNGRRESERSQDHYSFNSRRNRSRSSSPRSWKPARAGSISPKHHRESASPRTKRSSQAGSRSPSHHKGSRSSPTRDHRTAASHHSRHSRSRSAERKHHSCSKEDLKDSEKLYAERKHHSTHKEVIKDSEKASTERKHQSSSKDVRDPEKSMHESRKSDRSYAGKDAKGSREPADDRTMDSSTMSHKRSSLAEDGSSKHERASSHRKRSKHDQNAEKFDSIVEDQSGIREDFELIEEKRSVHKRGSTHDNNNNDDNADDTHGENRESRRHNRSSSGYRKHERTDPATKERDSVADESFRARDDRRSSHHSSSRSHRSSRHMEERSSGDSRCHHRGEGSEENYKNSQRVNTITKESRSSDKKQDRTVVFSEMKTDGSRSYSPEEEVRRDSKSSRERIKGEPEKSDSLASKPDLDGCYLEGGKKNPIFDPALSTHTRSPMPQNHEESAMSTDDSGGHEASKLERENLESYKHKGHINRDAADREGSEQPERIGVTAKYDQGSTYYGCDRPQETGGTVKDMEGGGYEFEKSVMVEISPSALDANNLSPRDLKKAEMFKNECSKLVGATHEYIHHNSADSDHDLLPKEDVDGGYCLIDYELGVQKNDTSGYCSKLATPEYLLQGQIKDLNRDGESDADDKGAGNIICIQEKYTMLNGFTNQVPNVDVANSNMDVESRQDASETCFKDKDSGDVVGCLSENSLAHSAIFDAPL